MWTKSFFVRIVPSYSKKIERGRSFLSDWEEARYQVGGRWVEKQLDDEEQKAEERWTTVVIRYKWSQESKLVDKRCMMEEREVVVKKLT